MNEVAGIVEQAMEMSPLLQTTRQENAEQSIMKWGDTSWEPLPSCWQPASDPVDEWYETELIPEPV